MPRFCVEAALRERRVESAAENRREDEALRQSQVKRELREKRMAEERKKKIDYVFDLYSRQYNVYHGDAPREVIQGYQESLDVIRSGTYDRMMIKEFGRYLDMVRSKEWTTIRNETGADFSIFDFLNAFPKLY